MKEQKRIDLVGCGISSLVESGNEQYVKHYNNDTKLADDVEQAIKSNPETYRDYRGVVQGLFNSGFLDLSESDFNTDQLFGYIYGVKCVEKVDWFMTLHAWLLKKGYTDHSDWDKKWNTSGDNYFSAYEFTKQEDSDPVVDKIIEKESTKRKKVYKVVIMENQSPTYATVMRMSEFTGEPKTMYLVKLKADYNSKDRLAEFLEVVQSGEIEKNYKWSAFSSRDYGVITAVDIDDMQATPVIMPKAIESILLNINSGHTCIEMEEDE